MADKILEKSINVIPKGCIAFHSMTSKMTKELNPYLSESQNNKKNLNMIRFRVIVRSWYQKEFNFIWLG